MSFYLKKPSIVLLTILIGLAFSCTKELSSEIENENINYRIRHRDFEFIESNQILLNKLSSFSENNDQSKNGKLSKNIRFGDETDEFVIFTDRVTEVASLNGLEHSYTFFIKRKSKGEFNTIENLILTSDGEGGYKSHIAKYFFPKGLTSDSDNFEVKEFREISQNEASDLFGKSNRNACINVQYVVYEIKHDCYSGTHSGNGEAEQCDGQGSLPYSTFTIHYVCGVGGGGGGTTTGGGSGTGGSNTGGTVSNPPPTGDNVANTGITLPPSCQTNDCGDESTIVNEINSLLNNELTTDQLIYLFNDPILADEVRSSILNKTLVTAFPLVKYPLGSKYSKLYPKLTEYLKNQLPKIADNDFIVNKMVQYGDLNEVQIKSILEWGKGPTIKIEQLGSHDGFEVYGKYSKLNPKEILVDIDLVNDLENSTSGSEFADGHMFLIGVSILHELIHFSEYVVDGSNNAAESGNLFEIATYGQLVYRDNASIILKGN